MAIGITAITFSVIGGVVLGIYGLVPFGMLGLTVTLLAMMSAIALKELRLGVYGYPLDPAPR